MFLGPGRHIVLGNGKRHKFSARAANYRVDFATNLAALKVAPSVVSVESYSGDVELFQCSGTVMESDDTHAIVLTSSYLIRCPSGRNSMAPKIKLFVHLPTGETCGGDIVEHDFHYNIAAIRIKTNSHLPVAPFTCLNDTIPTDSGLTTSLLDRTAFGLRPHSNSFSIVPGDAVCCVGRFSTSPYELMAAPGIFSDERHNAVCRELFVATCNITRCGIGGPLINCFGDVLGICFYEWSWTPFLPTNLVMTWWEQHKKYGKLRRPAIGMDIRNLSSTRVDLMEAITRKFPNMLQAIYVDGVKPGSSVEAGGLKNSDVIIQYGGRDVRSVLEVLEVCWKKVGEVVEVVVIREGNDVPVHLSISIDELPPDRFYCWKTWENVP